MTNSTQKGKVGEREWAAYLRSHGIEARRGQQYSGGGDSPDVVSTLPIHWEVKRVERLNVDKAMAQAVGDAGEDTPAVAHRRNRGEWLITMRAEDLVRTLKLYGPVSKGLLHG